MRTNLALRPVLGITAGLAAVFGLTTTTGLSAGTINISGSSTVYPITNAAIEGFQKTSKGQAVQFSLRETGSSAGLRQFCNGNIPLANASRPISGKELKRCAKNGINFIELPIAFDAITVVVNPANNAVNTMTISELSRLWRKKSQGKVMTWNQVNLDFPSAKLSLCGPGKNSGTFEVFNKTVNGSKRNSRTDYFASEDDNKLVDCVAKDNSALAYFGYSYYKNNANRLKVVKIVNAKGIAVAPSVESVQSEDYQPLSRPLFLYVNDKQLRSNKKFRQFVIFLPQEHQQTGSTKQLHSSTRLHLQIGGFKALPAHSRYKLRRRSARGNDHRTGH